MLNATALRYPLGLFAILMLQQGAHAQMVAADRGPTAAYIRGEHLGSHQRFAAAIGQNDGLLPDVMLPSVLAESAEFASGEAATTLFNADAEPRLQRFVAEHPEHPNVAMARFHLGILSFRKKKYNATIDQFALTIPKELNPDQLEEYYFKLGYAQFQEGRNAEAKVSFNHITEAGTRYKSAAIYYFAHIQYAEGQWEAALQGFKKLEDDALFGPVAPYYIVQIEFLQKRYDEVIAYGQQLLAKEGKRKGEVSGYVGESLYRKGKFAEAIPYLETAVAETGADRGKYYQIGYSAYRTGDCQKAATNFEKVTTEEDTMSQVAYYQMADCMLRKGEKVGAQSAFRMAARYKFDPAVEEDALFNFAKLAYELSFDPYHEAIRAFEEYLRTHPKSARTDEAYGFLLKVYMATNNYEAAMTAIDKMTNRGPEIQLTFQRAAYARGIELFNAQNYNAAIQALKKSQQLHVDPRLEALAEYWQADAYARLGVGKSAQEKYISFLRMPGAPASDVYALGHYGLAYIHFEQKQYTEAIARFRQFAQVGANDKLRLTDAYLRIADAFYITRETTRAIEYYNMALQLDRFDTDYAMFQIAVCYGLQGNTASKIESLKELLEQYPTSNYAPDATYEIAEAYLNKNNDTEAEKWFDRLIATYPHSTYMAKAKLNKGLIAYNRNLDQKAIKEFKEVAEGYPATNEAKEALLKLQKIYVEDGNVTAFESYVKEKKFPELTTASLDSSYYESAEILYMNGQQSMAGAELKKYVERYPKGIFKSNAYFYLADIAQQQGKKQEALDAYNVVLGQPRSIFTEKSLYSAALLLMEQRKYEEALLRLSMLEELAELEEHRTGAKVGIMRAQVALERCDPAMAYAEKLIVADRIEPRLKQEATMVLGRCAYAQGNWPVARSMFNNAMTLGDGNMAAEALYQLARTAFAEDSLTVAEAHVVDLVNRFSNYPDHVSSGFLLLSDINLKKGDEFQAKLILQNIVANFDGAQRDEAAKRLAAMEAKEAEAAPATPAPQPVELEFETPDRVNENIFEQDETAPKE